ncbi:hypothetical protein HaLaN_08659, partial [Haematococcus lacustris]
MTTLLLAAMVALAISGVSAQSDSVAVCPNFYINADNGVPTQCCASASTQSCDNSACPANNLGEDL